jgi:hypothetical protein
MLADDELRNMQRITYWIDCFVAGLHVKQHDIPSCVATAARVSLAMVPALPLGDARRVRRRDRLQPHPHFPDHLHDRVPRALQCNDQSGSFAICSCSTQRQLSPLKKYQIKTKNVQSRALFRFLD